MFSCYVQVCKENQKIVIFQLCRLKFFSIFIKMLDAVYKRKKKNESFLYFFHSLFHTLPLNQNFRSIKFIRNIVSSYSKRFESEKYRNIENDGTEVDICRFLGRHSPSNFWHSDPALHCESLVDKHRIPRGSSIFSLANFNESRIIEIPTISCNWQRIKLPHIRPSPRKRLLSLFLENMDENQTKDSTS